MLKIVPKIGENNYKNIELIKTYVDDKLEIQLLSDNLNIAFENSKKIIEDVPSLNYIVLHLPFSLLNLSHIHSNYNLELRFISFIVDVIKYSNKTGKEIDILFHIGTRTKYLISMGGIEFLKYITNLVEGTSVGFLMENEIVDLTMDDDEKWVLEGITEIFKHPKLNICLDLCHLQASEYVLEKKLYISKNLLSILKTVHFSMTLDRKGYIEKKRTHGRAHESLNLCLQDLEYLKTLGVNLSDVLLITEISENDYILRPDMLREISYLKRISEEGCVECQ